MREIIGRFERDIKIHPAGNPKELLDYSQSFSAVEELELVGNLDPRAGCLLGDLISHGSVVNFAEGQAIPAIGLNYSHQKKVAYRTESVKTAVELMAERADNSLDIVFGPQYSGSSISEIFAAETGIPALPIYKTEEGAHVGNGKYIGAYVPSYTHFGKYDLLRLKIDELISVIGSHKGIIRVGLVEDIIDTFRVANVVGQMIDRLKSYGIAIALTRVMALYDKVYMQTPERLQAEANGIAIDGILRFVDMGIDPSWVRIEQLPDVSLQCKANDF